MTFNLLNWLMLFGMVAVVIPPLIHLLNRRRYDVVDWGAMQFLQISDAKRRRLLIEELLLMGLRMLLIAVMVLALCAPYAVSNLFSSIGLEKHRDVVLVFGGSAGMEATGSHEKARKWAVEFLDTLAPGDSVTILQAKKQVVPVLAEPTRDFDLARKAIEELPPPGGGCDWAEAVREAHRILEKSQRPLRDIILLGNGQKNGWADPDSLGDWEALAGQLPLHSEIKPSVWAVNFDPKRPASPPSWSLAPLRAKRLAVYVKQDVEFQTALLLYNQIWYQPPERVEVEVDGDLTGRRFLKFPSAEEFANKKPAPEKGGEGKEADVLTVPLPPFRLQFKTPGSHLVSVFAKLKSGRTIRQDYALQVMPLPVLIVDGEPRQGVDRRRSDFLRLALDPRKDATKEAPSAVLAQVVSYQDFGAQLLDQDIDKAHPGTKPRVLVLGDVPELNAGQRQAISQFLANGGGLLITLGGEAEKNLKFYNEFLYQDGKGWLPAPLERVVNGGAAADVRPQLQSFQHPALELFRQEALGGLNDASFPRWWKALPLEKDNAVAFARLTSKDPWLVERTYQGGRVILCTVPLMNSWDARENAWDSNLIRLPVFAPLAHELVHYLAGNLAAGEKSQLQINYNLQPGQPLYYGQDGTEAEGNWTLEIPGDREGKPLRIGPGPRLLDEHRAKYLESSRAPGSPAVPNWPIVDFPDTYHTGVYTLRVPLKNNWLPPDTARFFNDTLSSRRTVYYTVHSDDPREFDLTPWSAADQQRVARQVPVTYENRPKELLTTLSNQANKQELWWLFMVAVVALLCFEVWLTRRIVRARH